MKTEKQIEVTLIGGAIKTLTEITTDERKGNQLGSAITSADILDTEATDHVERENDETMTFSFGTVRKDRIKNLILHEDRFGAEIRFVTYAR
jgi:hypothetical protein